jgi:hypothetical protein
MLLPARLNVVRAGVFNLFIMAVSWEKVLQQIAGIKTG